VTGLFFGFIPTVISVLIISGYRIFLGGPGVLMGVSVTILTACVGLLWRRFRWDDIILFKKIIWPEFYLFGLITHIIMLACTIALPQSIRFDTIKQISLPVMLVYPLGSLLLCIVMQYGMKTLQTKLDLEDSELRFRTMFEQAPIGIAITRDHKLLYSNSMYAKILGRTKEEIMTLDWKDYKHPDDSHIDRSQFKALKSGEIEGYSIPKRYIKPDGSIVWVNLTTANIKFGNQPTESHLCMVEDITEAKKAEESLQNSKTNYKNLYHEFQAKEMFLTSLLNSITDLIFYKDLEGVYMGVNQAFEKLLGLESKEIVGCNDFGLFDKQIAESYREADITLMNKKCDGKTEESVAYSDGSKAYFETIKTPYFDQEGKVLGVIGVSRDITDRKQKEEEIVYLNYHDILTGLYNRTFFDKERQRLESEEQLPMSFIIGDINGLKIINDAFGHAQGDKLLVETAQILSKCCRAEDIIARTGGDEFCVLLPKTDSNITKIIFDRIKKTCEDYSARTDKVGYFTSISLGYSTKTKKEETFDSVYKEAEENMYRRKLLEHKSLHNSLLTSIKSTMLEKSNETEEHAERLADLSKKLGKELGLKDEDLVELELFATLHDVGKLSIDQNVLAKPDTLSEKEWTEIKKHPMVGYRIAQAVTELRHISEYILCHHERWDGKGYPQGLAGEEIPLLARILSVVDAYDAMTQDRTYRKAMTKDEAIAEIKSNSGTQFDANVASIFIERVLND
ncbi:MAG: PAS domain S-box protein, partial [Eubacteriales bacterium]